MLTLARAERDSAQYFALAGAYSGYLEFIGDIDGAVAALRDAHAYAPPTSGMQYPSGVVSYRPELYEEMLPVYREAANRFKAAVPENLWPMADAVEDAMKAFAARDTSAIIDYYENTLARPEAGVVNVIVSWNLGKYQQLTGRYEDAIPHLENARLAGAGNVPTTSAHRYLDATYRLGACFEGVGRADEAREAYREVLRYWGEADIEVEAVRGSRAGLARLTS
jgi:tetratricopeptide (TPR) repeat protein